MLMAAVVHGGSCGVGSSCGVGGICGVGGSLWCW